jgi:hypothetical protein
MAMDLAVAELQRMYNSEINFAIETMWDAGFTVRLGDKKNGYKVKTIVKTLEEAVTWLRAQARVYFPNSEYVRSYPISSCFNFVFRIVSAGLTAIPSHQRLSCSRVTECLASG